MQKNVEIWLGVFYEYDQSNREQPKMGPRFPGKITFGFAL